jgi:hypothetical protein
MKTIILIYTAMRSFNLTFSKGTKLCPYCFVFDFSLMEWACYVTDAGWMESHWRSLLSGITGIQAELSQILAGSPVIVIEVFNSFLSPSTHSSPVRPGPHPSRYVQFILYVSYLLILYSVNYCQHCLLHHKWLRFYVFVSHRFHKYKLMWQNRLG